MFAFCGRSLLAPIRRQRVATQVQTALGDSHCSLHRLNSQCSHSLRGFIVFSALRMFHGCVWCCFWSCLCACVYNDTREFFPRCFVYAGVRLASADWGTWILHTECVNSGWTPGCTVSGTLWQPRPNDPARDCTVHGEVLYSRTANPPPPPPPPTPTSFSPSLFPRTLPHLSALPSLCSQLFSISPSMLFFSPTHPLLCSLLSFPFSMTLFSTREKVHAAGNLGETHAADLPIKTDRLSLMRHTRTSWSGSWNEDEETRFLHSNKINSCVISFKVVSISAFYSSFLITPNKIHKCCNLSTNRSCLLIFFPTIHSSSLKNCPYGVLASPSIG